MNQLKVFNNEEFGEIRTITIDDTTMFCLVDVCKSLNIKNATDVAKRLDEDEVTRFNLGGKSGETNFITESGLYAVILRSDKKKAREFRKWVTSEVLPSIRKSGGYQLPQTTDGKIQLLAQGHTELAKKIEDVNKDLQDFKNDMPLLALECQKITRAKNQKVVPLMGGKDSSAYKDKSLRGKVYSDIDGQIRRQFGVDTYKAIKRSQCDLAIELINKYELPLILKEKIDFTNAQMKF